MKKILIAPSILSADFRALEREVRAAEDAGADMIHCDVMDGHFVPNLTFGPFVVEAVKKCVSVPLDVHLMISDPEKYAGEFCDAGADILTFHAEALRTVPGDRRPHIGHVIRGLEYEAFDIKMLLREIERRGVTPGISVNPDKPVELFMDVIEAAGHVLIMSVYAGFGGQKFIPEVLDKIRDVREAAVEMELDIDIAVDGGINGETAALCAEAGANILVAGNYVFKSGDYAERIKAVRDSGTRGQGDQR